jgi:hypothetical protein
MSFPARFAGYDSPDLLVSDEALTPEQKMSALLIWRAAARREGGSEVDPDRRRLLIAELDRALKSLNRRSDGPQGS